MKIRQHARTSAAKHGNLFLFLLVLLGAASEAPAEEGRTIEVVEVTASSTDMSAGGDIGADEYYDAAQIEAFGASTLEELLEELAPDVASVRGRLSGKPVVLVNGRRIASFTGIRRYPPEAVKSIEVFPEEVALRHGYRANQKVINIQLRPRFRATTLRGSAQIAEGNEGAAGKASADYLRLKLDNRLSFDLEAATQNDILESDRSVPARLQGRPFSLEGNLRSPGGGEIDAVLSALAGETVTTATLPEHTGHAPLTLASLLPTANSPLRSDTQDYRSLAPQRQKLSSGVSYSFPINERLLATVSGSFEQSDQTSFLDLPRYSLLIPADDPFSPFGRTVELNRFSQFSGPLKREQDSDVYTLSADVAATYKGWTWSWITNLKRTERTTTTDRGVTVDTLPAGNNPFGDISGFLQLQTDRQDSEIHNYETLFLVDGSIGELPQGPISVALSGAFTRNEQRHKTSNLFASNSPNNSPDGSRRLERRVSQLRANISAPLLHGKRSGKLSANLNGEFSHYSDFDQITAFGAVLNWRLKNRLSFLLSYSREEGAPDVAKLGDPLLLTPNQSVYDFANNTSVSATRVSGGNPALKPDTQEIWRAGIRVQPFKKHDLSFRVDWVDRTTNEPIDGFPTPSEEIEAVFPERFIRGGAGNLQGFDTRPINLHLERTKEVSSGFRYKRAGTKNFRRGKHATRATNTAAAGKPRRADKGNLTFALDHTWTLENELVIAPGLGAIDYVGRNTNGRGRGGAEHELNARFSYYRNGTGFRITAKWQDSVSTLPNADGISDLQQADLYTVNLTAFHLFRPASALVKRFRMLSGTRVRLNVDNVFNDKKDVRDRNGIAPAGRSGDELDPFGRTIKLEVRKMFR